MLKLAVLALCVVVCVATDLETEWTVFKAKFNRLYTTDEEPYRKLVFASNLEYIRRHNEAADRGEYTYWTGVNQFTDMTNAEFQREVLGLRYNANTAASDNLYHPTISVDDLPSTVDWRTKGYVTPVKNQGGCGSCWAFSATGSLEGQHFKKTKNLVSLSEQNLVDCSWPEGNMGCGGGLMDQAFAYVKKNKGIDTEASYPYKAVDEKCHFKRGSVGATLTSWKDIAKGSEQALMTAVAEVGPISVAIDASHPSFQSYKTGIYNEPLCSSTDLDHGVLAVGYGVQGGTDYWLVKNSWGTTWGQKGYIQMSRNKHNQCGIATQASYPVV